MSAPSPLPKRERDQVARMERAFAAIDALLARLGQQGLQRVSRASATELAALKQTAHSAGLIRIERELELLTTLLRRYLERDPLFTVDAYGAAINRVWLLNRAARARREAGDRPSSMLELIGEARRSYVELERELVLQPLGASGWVSDTDFVGVTVYFHASDEDRLLQASNAKPCMYFGRDPRRLLFQQLSDHVDRTIYELAHGAFVFRKAKISSDGRLSLHRELGVAPAPGIGAQAYQSLAVSDWIELVERLRRRELDPVARGRPLFAYLEPAGYGPLEIDEKRARATLELVDGRGAPLLLAVPLRPENNFLVDNLERMALTSPRKENLRPDGLFGRAWASRGVLEFAPITAIYHEPITLRMRGEAQLHELHLSLEPLDRVVR